MNAAVLGGAGFLGTNLVRRLVRDGATGVVVVDSLEPRLRSTTEGIRGLDGVSFIRGDIRDVRLLESTLSGVDVVFNLAAQTSHVLSLADPEWDASLNATSALRVLETARRVNPDALHVFPSTSSVMGRNESTVDEDTPQKPRDFYSAHKAVAEHYYRVYATLHGVRAAVLRFPNLYGPFGKPYEEFGFLNYFISRAWLGEDLVVFDDGAQVRNVLFVDDAIDAMIAVVADERVRTEPLFVSGEEHLSVRDIAETIVSVFGRGRVLRARFPEDRRRIDPASVQIDGSRFRALTGWRPAHQFVGGLRSTHDRLGGTR